MKNNTFTILTFYQFRQLTELDKLKVSLEKFFSFNKLRGLILIAPEGINGTIAGLNEPMKLYEPMKLHDPWQNNVSFTNEA